MPARRTEYDMLPRLFGAKLYNIKAAFGKDYYCAKRPFGANFYLNANDEMIGAIWDDTDIVH